MTLQDRSGSILSYTAERVGRLPVSARLYAKSCEDMSEVADESVTLTVTSPPYWNAIDYDRHARNPSESYRTREYSAGFQDYESYLTWLTGVFGHVLDKTRPGGYLAVVVGTVLLGGRAYAVPFDLSARLTREGWEFHQDIVWHKSTGGVKRAGVFIQHPYPGYYRPNIMTEYILVFRKPGSPIFRTVSSEHRDRGKYRVGALFTKEIANNVWHIAPIPPRASEHPCPFPEEIPYRLILLYTYPGDTVLDPFIGSGQTAKVAYALHRNAVGYDIVEKYIEYSYWRLEEPLAIRTSQLVAEFKHMPLDAPLGYGGRVKARTRHGSGVKSASKKSEAEK
ncbi:MAG: DNA-methyltransferase [Bacillota bacterium]